MTGRVNAVLYDKCVPSCSNVRAANDGQQSVPQKSLSPQFRAALRHFIVMNPRLSIAEPSVFSLELTKNLLELADFIF